MFAKTGCLKDGNQNKLNAGLRCNVVCDAQVLLRDGEQGLLRPEHQRRGRGKLARSVGKTLASPI
jgi:hypothetical protein